MKGAIASVEIFGRRAEDPMRRFTLTLAAPARIGTDPSPPGDAWECRVALADLHRPLTVTGADSIQVLARALEVAHRWVAELRGQGFSLYRDRAGKTRFELV